MWLCWFADQWDRPSRTDWYLMAICAEVRRVLARHPNRIQTEHFQLKFKQRGETAKVISRDQADQVAKARWLGGFQAMGVRVRIAGKDC